MTLKDDFGDEMAQTVTIHPYKSNDGFDDSYDAGIEYSCIVTKQQIELKKDNGDVWVSSFQLHLDGEVDISLRDKIVFDGRIIKSGYIGTDYDIEFPSDIYATVIYT